MIMIVIFKGETPSCHLACQSPALQVQGLQLGRWMPSKTPLNTNHSATLSVDYIIITMRISNYYYNTNQKPHCRGTVQHVHRKSDMAGLSPSGVACWSSIRVIPEYSSRYYYYYASHRHRTVSSRLRAQGSDSPPLRFGEEEPPPPPSSSSLVYQGIVFDMDGTLSVSCIDYQLMRKSLDIPEGDLFTVMETWDDGDRISSSMDTILEIEDVAARQSRGMPGLEELLEFLSRQGGTVKVGLVTRNTEYSVNAFFKAIGEEYREVFDIVMTREYPFVKPDKRCLTYFATMWGIPPSRVLMVGDSVEDVECGNAAGTASCLILGGGNEINASPGGDGSTIARPPRGTVPSFCVDSLYELKERLEKGDTPLGWAEFDDASQDEDAGAPFDGLGFFNFLFESGAIDPPSCSFPRLRSTMIRNDSSDEDAVEVADLHPGARVLHLGCGDGGLTKMLFSAGLNVVGADVQPDKARRRGLATISYGKDFLTDATAIIQAVESQLSKTIFPPDKGFDALVFFQEENTADQARAILSSPETLRALYQLAAPQDGRCIFQVYSDGENILKVPTREELETITRASGWTISFYDSMEVVENQQNETMRCILTKN